MNRIRHSNVATLLAFLAIAQLIPITALAEPPTTPKTPSSQPTVSKVVPLMKGKPAPFSGLLVPEKRFTQDLYRKVEVNECKHKLKLRDNTHADQTQVWKGALNLCQQDLNKRAQPTPWYKSVKFWLPVGLIVGLAGGIFIYHGASELAHK
jgi:hypothetical protein